MFRSLRARLIIVYSLIIFVTILTVDILILGNYFRSSLEERTITYFTHGNMAANIVSGNPNNMLYISETLEQYTLTAQARFLLINTQSVVTADSAHRFTGQKLTNPQVRDALAGRSSWDVYNGEGRYLQLAVPVTAGDRENMQVNGAVLISADIQDLFTTYSALRWKVVLISLLAGIAGAFFSFVAAYRLSGPLNKLIAFSKKLSQGYLGHEVQIQRNDEIGQLAETINTMSTGLYHIEANRRKFIGDVSHELKTPLASIKALVEALLMGQSPPGQYREFLGDVIIEVDRLSSLISRLLTLTRLEEESPSKEYACISDIVRDTVRVMTPFATSHNVYIKNNVLTNTRVLCDKNLVKEILVNLLDNSIKYRDKEKAVNEIEIKDSIMHGTYRLEISDNGIGIAGQDLPRLFEGFFRSEPSRSKEIEGYGMGLTIVKKITDLHGWDIWVESQPGVGTVISITIPLN